MPIAYTKISDKITAAFPGAEFTLVDLMGDNNHYQLQIKSKEFRGLSRIAQHKMVYNALGECVGNELHAIALKTEAL
jgi:stress-induced morphogen